MIDQNVKKQILELPVKERAELASLLIDSLHPEDHFETEEEWSNELNERIKRYESGAGKTTSWDEVKIKAQKRIK